MQTIIIIIDHGNVVFLSPTQLSLYRITRKKITNE